VSCLKKY